MTDKIDKFKSPQAFTHLRDRKKYLYETHINTVEVHVSGGGNFDIPFYLCMAYTVC